jgi:DnaJ-domain-containing protein 1
VRAGAALESAHDLPSHRAPARALPAAARAPRMNWTGKAAGVLLGLLSRRWQLALLGLVIGHLFDLGVFGARKPAAAAPTPESDPYRELGVEPSATDAQIEAAYRRLIAQYHPDRVAGAGPELRELAETRARSINTAYERIQKIRRGAS